MKNNKFGEIIFEETDLCNLVMKGVDLTHTSGILVDSLVDLTAVSSIVDQVPKFTRYNDAIESLTVQEFDMYNQQNWYMPDTYKELDIALHLLNLCSTQGQLQRVGQELLLYQERNLFDLLRYLKYLVDTMKENDIVWGVGRGSSVASYVLYLLGVHRIDSLHYDLDPAEFLR
jgi:DNA polymerase III alpha subunit